MIVCIQIAEDFTFILETTCLSSQSSHCVKSLLIRSYFGSYSVRIRKNMDQNNSEYEHFLHSSTYIRYGSFSLKIIKHNMLSL